MLRRLTDRFAAWKRRKNTEFIARWPQGGGAHPWRFALLHGVLGFTLPIALGPWALMYFLAPTDRSFMNGVFLLCMPIFTLCGLGWGFCRWAIFQWHFRRLIQRRFSEEIS